MQIGSLIEKLSSKFNFFVHWRTDIKADSAEDNIIESYF